MPPTHHVHFQTPPDRTWSAQSPSGSPKFSARGGLRAFDQNQTRAWPGRKDPCNMAEKIQPLLQVLVDQLDNGNLTPAQQALAKQDLAMIATRCFCQGHVGTDHALTVNIHGKPLKLDAVDLTLLLNNCPPQALCTAAFEQAAQNHTLHSQVPRKIKLSNPEPQVAQWATGGNAANIQQLFAQPNLASPLYREMNELIRQAPVKAFDVQQQLVAKQVIDLLPTAAQGKLRNVDARLIGVRDFIEVMRAAANEKQLPTELQHFRDSCSRNDGLKKAIYCDPNIAARILGLSTPLPGDQPSNQTLARGLANQMVEQTSNVYAPRTQVSKIVKRLISGGMSASTAMAKHVFKMLGDYAGFASQEMAQVPTCFPDIECPEASKVQMKAPIHANVVSLGDGRQAIAAMQPVHTPGSESSNLPTFYELLASEANTTVFDLRSIKDLEQGSFDYCPSVGETRKISNAATGEQIQITTLEQKPLQQAQSRELTVRIQMGNQAPKLTKVIQFKNWPDHGVITSAQLRSLSHLMNKELGEHQRVITHCRAGVGRTGTLLAYENLRHSLIDLGQGKTMVSAQGKVDSTKLLLALTEVVAQGRIERGPYFVQSEEQFLLLYETLKADLEGSPKNQTSAVPTKPSTSKPTVAVAATPPLQTAMPPIQQQNPIELPAELPIRQLGLGVHPPSNFSPEPASQHHGLRNWQSILDAGHDVVEIVSDSNRLVGALSPSTSGLGIFLDQIVPKQSSPSNLQLGNKCVLAVRQTDTAQTQGDGLLVYKQRFEIQYQTVGDTEVKTLYFTQFLTPFDGKQLTAGQLNDITEQLGEAGQLRPKWLTSVRGMGRPSALLVAQAMREEIAEGRISNEQGLIEVLDAWIAVGREKMGPLFIHSREQRQQLIELGKAWLNNRQA